MRIGIVNNEHSTLILSFSVFALKRGLPLCDHFISNTIKNSKQQKLWGNHTKSCSLKRNLKNFIV